MCDPKPAATITRLVQSEAFGSLNETPTQTLFCFNLTAPLDPVTGRFAALPDSPADLAGPFSIPLVLNDAPYYSVRVEVSGSALSLFNSVSVSLGTVDTLNSPEYYTSRTDSFTLPDSVRLFNYAFANYGGPSTQIEGFVPASTYYVNAVAALEQSVVSGDTVDTIGMFTVSITATPVYGGQIAGRATVLNTSTWNTVGAAWQFVP